MSESADKTKVKRTPAFSNKFGKWANLYTKPDIERLGLFMEMPYLLGKYKTKQKVEHERPNIVTRATGGLFEKEFQRIFIGEAIKRRRKHAKPVSSGKGPTKQPFVPFLGGKLYSRDNSPGDYFNYFSKFEYFSGKSRGKPPYKPQRKNFYTSPGKKGNCGYVNICLSTYPEHLPEPYKPKFKKKTYTDMRQPFVSSLHPKAYFKEDPYIEDPAPGTKPGPIYRKFKRVEKGLRPPGYILPTGPGKLKGGCQDGGFAKWPTHSNEKYYRPPKRKEPSEAKTTFLPHSRAPKTLFTSSVLNQNVVVTQNNYQTIQPTYTKRLLSY